MEHHSLDHTSYLATESSLPKDRGGTFAQSRRVLLHHALSKLPELHNQDIPNTAELHLFALVGDIGLVRRRKRGLGMHDTVALGIHADIRHWQATNRMELLQGTRPDVHPDHPRQRNPIAVGIGSMGVG